MNAHQLRVEFRKYIRELEQGKHRNTRQGSGIMVQQHDYIASLPISRRARIVRTLLELGIERVKNGPAAYDEPISIENALRALGRPEQDAINSCLKPEGGCGSDAVDAVTLFLFQHPIKYQPGDHNG